MKGLAFGTLPFLKKDNSDRLFQHNHLREYLYKRCWEEMDCGWMVEAGRVTREREIQDVVLLLLMLFLMPATVHAVTFSCNFTASCSGTGLLRAKNFSAGFNNAHVELMNATPTYPATLCCVTDANHTLDYNCTNENATVVLRANGSTNTHVQRPGVTPQYTHDICMALSPGNLSCEYVNGSCDAGYAPVLSMASSEDNNGLYNLTNAHVENYSHYLLSVCCKGGNSPPTTPTLLYPAQGNDTVFERNITFDWTDSTDPDGDPFDYDFNLTQATCADDYQDAVAASSYTSGELCVDKVYWWKVRACDTGGCSAWTPLWNFTIASVLGLTFDVNNTNFGTLARNATDNTTDNAPSPFIVNNTGNVPLNVTFAALDPLFDTSGLGNDSFQYKARAYETGAFDSGQTNWTNVSITNTSLYTNFHYQDVRDAAYVDILVRLPYEEPAGSKSSTVEVTGTYG